MTAPTRSPYQGLQRKLVLAFDIGTTYSGISFSILDPGIVPEITPVTRFPAQEYVSGTSKIPTLVYYDRTGKVRAVGAEAMREGIYEVAEEEKWVKAEWFKLHLRSKVGAGRGVTSEIPPLPLNKTVNEVFADFLRYLLECASAYIQSTNANGADLWASVENQIDFVLSHPNGWEGAQQSEMRTAAVMAGLIPDNPAGHARLTFVTEGEASLHFSIQNGLPSGAMKNGDGVVIVDAGGGTIDISAYSKTMGAGKDTFEEIAAPQCHFHGSVFVSIHARLYLEQYLARSKFIDDLEHIVRQFDKTTKLRFMDSTEMQYVQFGSARDNDQQYNIRFGQLKLQGADVAAFFEPSIECITKAVLSMAQKKSSHKPICHVVLVGGFSENDWLFEKVHSALTPAGLNILRPGRHVNKSVTDGAISYYLDHFVSTRVSKFTYGEFIYILFDPTLDDHQIRENNVVTLPSGEKRVRDSFDVILPKNTQVSEVTEFRRARFCEAESREDFKSLSVSVWCYRGTILEPKWADVDTKNYAEFCKFEFDASDLPLQLRTGPGGGRNYYRVDYESVLLFGLTELKAFIAWKENGIEKRSVAKIFYHAEITNE
ncbi:hypothetical protein CVT24_006217 [Panaeolus cyanescens]|uniref:Uncharacterized protein n=1 Tax=Panaeolus cyanescens TaxID=181874 RepID=A0A409YED0_9AGAR|nr:hypothetical protein CVT24_006217 [Panaeolus cyanescens]